MFDSDGQICDTLASSLEGSKGARLSERLAMSSQYVSILVVRQDALPETPAAFQQYVAEYFAEKNVFGIPCYYAAEALHWGGTQGNRSKGAAPSHSVERMRFKEGLGRGQNLGSWIEQAVKKGVVLKFGGGWDDGLREYAD